MNTGSKSKETTNQGSVALVVTADDEMYMQDYPPSHYEVIDGIVGGLSEDVHPRGLKPPYCMSVNENGHRLGLPLNRLATGLYGTGDHIVGDIAILKDGYYNCKPDIVGLTVDEARKLGAEIIEVTFGGVRWAED